MSKEDLLHRAVQPTHERIRQLAERVPKTVRALLILIRDHYCDPNYPLFRLRRQAGASDWQVKVFQRALGIAPSDLRRQLRLETASLLLRDTSLSVKAVALLVGFKTESALRKLFSDLSAMTPSEVRLYLRQVVPEKRALGEELFSWYFWVRYHRGELEADDYRAALAFYAGRFGPA